MPRIGRAIFRAKVRELNAKWLACEGPDILGFEDDRTDVMALTRDREQLD